MFDHIRIGDEFDKPGLTKLELLQAKVAWHEANYVTSQPNVIPLSQHLRIRDEECVKRYKENLTIVREHLSQSVGLRTSLNKLIRSKANRFLLSDRIDIKVILDSLFTIDEGVYQRRMEYVYSRVTDTPYLTIKWFYEIIEDAMSFIYLRPNENASSYDNDVRRLSVIIVDTPCTEEDIERTSDVINEYFYETDLPTSEKVLKITAACVYFRINRNDLSAEKISNVLG